MPRAAVDPEELRRFAMELKRFNTEVQAEIVSVQRRFAKLGESWRDEQHRKFAEVFQKIVGTHSRLVDGAEQHVPVLLRKAQKIQDYLGPAAGGGAQHAADISSPDIIRDFRNHFLRFEERSKQAVSGVRSDCDRVLQWLQREQLQYWKEELRKYEEMVRQTRSQYLLARHGADALRKPSYVEEEKALRKAERRKEEAEHKIEAVKKWALVVEQQVKKLMGPINGLAGVLDSSAPLARARLDAMAQNIEDYLREAAPDGATP